MCNCGSVTLLISVNGYLSPSVTQCEPILIHFKSIAERPFTTKCHTLTDLATPLLQNQCWSNQQRSGCDLAALHMCRGQVNALHRVTYRICTDHLWGNDRPSAPGEGFAIEPEKQLRMNSESMSMLVTISMCLFCKCVHLINRIRCTVLHMAPFSSNDQSKRLTGQVRSHITHYSHRVWVNSGIRGI